MANYNGMSEESAKRLMMVSCLKENVENTLHQYEAIIERFAEILGAYKEAHDTLDDLLDQNRIPEFQKAFRLIHESAEETNALRIQIQKLKLHTFKSSVALVVLGYFNIH